MAEWIIAPVLKTGDPQGSVGSNPTPSASHWQDITVARADAIGRTSCFGKFFERIEDFQTGPAEVPVAACGDSEAVS